VAASQARILSGITIKGKGARFEPKGKEDAAEAAPTMLPPPLSYVVKVLTKKQQRARKRAACPICKKMVQAINKSAHERRCKGDKPHKCKIKDCDKAFVTKYELGVHMRVHTGSRPHKCKHKDCIAKGTAFAQSGNLTKHMRVHTGERPYKCKKCGRGFSHSGNVKACKCTGQTTK
jgi:hypothetical protein